MQFLTHSAFARQSDLRPLEWQQTPSSFGPLLAAFVGDTLVHLAPMDEDLSALERRYKRRAVPATSARDPMTAPMLCIGTPFQCAVWQALCLIPRGSVETYTWVADKIQKPQSHRAVGNAVGDNPIAIRIPCHRVIRKDGTLGGYRWGVEMKTQLLKAEGVMGF